MEIALCISKINVLHVILKQWLSENTNDDWFNWKKMFNFSLPVIWYSLMIIHLQLNWSFTVLTSRILPLLWIKPANRIKLALYNLRYNIYSMIFQFFS